MRSRSVISIVCWAVTAMHAYGATLVDVDPQMRKDAECMFGVLQTVPGIDQTKLDVSTHQGWTHPYLEYRAPPDKDGFRFIVRFNTYRTCTADIDVNFCSSKDLDYHFEATLPGLSTPGTLPSDWGTSDIERKWLAARGVKAHSFFI